MCFVISSKVYHGQPTDKIEELRDKELAEKGKTSIYLYDRRFGKLSHLTYTRVKNGCLHTRATCTGKTAANNARY